MKKFLVMMAAFIIINLQAVSIEGLFLYKIAFIPALLFLRSVKLQGIYFLLLSLCLLILTSIFTMHGEVGVFVQVTNLITESRFSDTFGSYLPSLSLFDLASSGINIVLAVIVVSGLSLTRDDLLPLLVWSMRFTLALSIFFFFQYDLYESVVADFAPSIRTSEASRWQVISLALGWGAAPRVHGFFMEPAVMFGTYLIFLSTAKIPNKVLPELLVYSILLVFVSQSYLGIITIIYIIALPFFQKRTILAVAVIGVSILPILFDLSSFGGSLAVRYTLPDIQFKLFGNSVLYAMSTNPIINMLLKFGYLGTLIFSFGILYIFGITGFLIMLLVSSGYPNLLDFMFLFPYLVCMFSLERFEAYPGKKSVKLFSGNKNHTRLHVR